LASVSASYVLPDGTGVEELFVSVIGAGVIVLIAAAFDIGRFLPLVPATVMIGFCNGLAIVIGHAQLDWFKTLDGEWLDGTTLLCTLAQTGVAFLIMLSLPWITRKLPASFVAIIVGALLERFVFRGLLDVPTLTLGDKSAFARSDATPQLFFLNDLYDMRRIQDFRGILVQSSTLAVVAILESLMTLEVVNDMTRTQGQPNRQVWALGVANVAAGLFGTMGGNALIELSVMNIQAGGVHRASSAIAALGVLVVMMCAFPLLNLIPAGSLAGIMVQVVLETFKWSSLPAIMASLVPKKALDERNKGKGFVEKVRAWLRGSKVEGYDAFIIVLVTVTTAVTNLAVAVFLGMFFASVRFAWQSQKPLEVRTDISEDGVKTYHLQGSLFFASKGKLASTFDPDTDPKQVAIDFKGAVVHDFSVCYNFHPLLERYAEKGTRVKLYNLSDATKLHNLLRFGNVQEGHEELRMTRGPSLASVMRSTSSTRSDSENVSIADACPEWQA